MSFLRPHTISIRRPTTPSGTSPLGYQGLRKQDEVVVATGIKANIAASRESRPVTSGLPSAVMFRTLYKIVFDGKDGLVRNRDVIVDQNGRRYQVLSVSWGSLGFSVLGELLEV